MTALDKQTAIPLDFAYTRIILNGGREKLFNPYEETPCAFWLDYPHSRKATRTMTHIITPQDKGMSRQDRYNDWVRGSIQLLSAQVQALVNNYLAVQRLSGITDEQVAHELKKMDEELKARLIPNDTK